MKELIKFLKGFNKLLIVGMGNPSRGDDSFGIITIKELKKKRLPKRVKILNVGSSIEAYLGVILKEDPSHIIFIDASEFGGRPGDVVIADPEQTHGRALTTHNIPIGMIVKYLKSMGLKAKFLLIGCEPKNLALFSPPSKEVRSSAVAVAKVIYETIKALSTS